ncbi:DUF1990 domain-containing protein [Streptosporangium sp. KLBMP 9127]|nr:DUF1990 domain-containing protein [Streptosporangium sp. KLBMP 9127]
MFTYPEVGATRDGDPPAGYRHLRRRTRLNGVPYTVAAEALMTWRGHTRLGLRPLTTAPRVAPGVTVTARLGPLAAPCRVIWVVEEATRTGFGYGTLHGHPVSGEESFLLELGDDGALWFTVTSFSRPHAWYARLAGPILPLLQHTFARLYGRGLHE